MGNLQAKVSRVALGAFLAVVLGASGCVTTSSSFWNGEGVAAENACQVVCLWQNNVMTVPDSVNNGAPMQGFAGRVYLFGKDGNPIDCGGKLTVDLIDESCEPEKWVERWNYDPETLQRLKRKDMMGWGFTVFLPSKEYRPDMTKIKLKTSFQCPKCAPIYSENVVTLDAKNGVIRQTNTQQPLRSAETTKFQPPIPIR